ncbi:MAG TPA: VWA domain-containing protein [Spirochaetia bacterium]|nr:VWA domain-containing protein [Spirochaetia bacterium]
MFSLEHPLTLLLLVFIPPLVYYRHIYPERGGRMPFSSTVWKSKLSIPDSRLVKVLMGISSAALWAGVVLLIIALSGPVLMKRERVFISRGIDIMFVLDESPSMAAQDFLPGNRFESAKDVIRHFLKGRENDPVGLVTFAQDAALRVSPTLDYEAFLSTLDELSLLDLGDGTAIGMGIAVACLHLRDSTAKEKVIVLITDGENNTGEITPETAADIAKKMGIRIHTIGIGSSGEVPIEYTDPKTGKTYRGLFKGGFDERLLQTIAELSGGKYFFASSPGSLDTIMKTIDSAETTERLVQVKIRKVPLYRQFVLIGLIFVLIDFFMRKLLLAEVAP